MDAIEYLKALPRDWLPKSVGHGIRPPSNTELRTWLKEGAIIINGAKILPNDEITFPITELIFFPKGIRRTTIVSVERGGRKMGLSKEANCLECGVELTGIESKLCSICVSATEHVADLGFEWREEA